MSQNDDDTKHLPAYEVIRLRRELQASQDLVAKLRGQINDNLDAHAELQGICHQYEVLLDEMWSAFSEALDDPEKRAALCEDPVQFLFKYRRFLAIILNEVRS